MDELFQLKEKTEEKKRLESQLNKAIQELNELNSESLQLRSQLKKELHDVEQLEGTGMTALFYSFLGNKVEKLQKERQEYISAKLKYENGEYGIRHLEIEIERIKDKIAELGNPETKYKYLLDAKSSRLKEKEDKKFIEYESLIETYLLHKNEVNEAIKAGEMALTGLRLAIQTLRKAQNCGTFDMLGGGIIATAVKHSNIDEAKSFILDVQVWLKKFKRELSDVPFADSEELAVQLDSFSTFADYFFDNLIFDWVVQSKINRSLEGCETIYSQVLEMVTQLRITDIDVTQKYKETKADFTTYIEKVSV